MLFMGLDWVSVLGLGCGQDQFGIHWDILVLRFPKCMGLGCHMCVSGLGGGFGYGFRFGFVFWFMSESCLELISDVT